MTATKKAAAATTKRGPGRPTKAELAQRATAAAAAATGAAKTDVVNRYDAAGRGRRLSGWNAPYSGPNRALVGSNVLRNRARDSVRNDWAGEAGVTKWATTLVGIGIRARFDKVTNISRRTKITAAWDDWCCEADAGGVLDFYGLTTLCVRAWIESGECFVRLRDRPENLLESGVPFQVQLLESDYCPYQLDTDNWPGMAQGNKIRQGIEFSPDGQRAAYWMYPEHPTDQMTMTAPTIANLVRVPADQILHVFEPKRPGQVRGVSVLAPILVRLRNLADFGDATLDRQKIANLFTMFITRELPPDAADIDFDPATGLPKFYNQHNDSVVTMESGMTQELQPGEDVKFANPPEAGTMFSEYMRTENMGVAAGQNIPYELHSGDIRNVSDRTLRVVIQEFRRFATQRQWQIVIPMFCQKVMTKWAKTAVLAGVVRPAEYDMVRKPTWSPHGFEYIHPVQDPQGKILEVQAGFRSRSDVIGERGDDAIDVDNQRAADMEREEALGLPDTMSVKTPVAPKPGALGGDSAGAGDDAETQTAPGQTGAGAGLDRFVEMMAPSFIDLVSNVATRMAQPPVAPVVHNHFSVIPPTVAIPEPVIAGN